MVIFFKCPHCEKTGRAKNHLAGKAAKCPGCGGTIRIGQPEPKATEPPARGEGIKRTTEVFPKSDDPVSTDIGFDEGFLSDFSEPSDSNEVESPQDFSREGSHQDHDSTEETDSQTRPTVKCPYCKTPFRDDVVMAGQTIVCPGCNAQVPMPQSESQQAMALISGIVGIVLGGLLLFRGCAFLDLADKF